LKKPKRYPILRVLLFKIYRTTWMADFAEATEFNIFAHNLRSRITDDGNVRAPMKNQRSAPDSERRKRDSAAEAQGQEWPRHSQKLSIAQKYKQQLFS
jgi:hypothetical protein